VEAEQLADDWARAWDKHVQTDRPTLAYWSVHDEKTGGVAVLVNPGVADTVTPWQQHRWTNRVIAVEIEDMVTVNIYAPNSHKEREEFFAELQTWPWEGHTIILAGDFNSVQSPKLDRLGGGRSANPESTQLQTLVEHLQLEDARVLEESVDDDAESVNATDFFTWWGPETASRIDRFYVPVTWTAKVQWVSVEEPAMHSDHQKVQLHFRDDTSRSRSKARKRGVAYPIKAARQDRIHSKRMQELIAGHHSRHVGRNDEGMR
jgi:exonuclease III